MEHTLRCNSLKCRKELNDHAVVTTCSHVFCTDCSNRFQLSDQREGQRRICPACDVHLPNPDDVVVTNLNPTEDYKTSVLSGLNPNVIMECAGRALSFWAYQTTQEIVYQEYLAKSLTDKYASLNTQLDKVFHDANGEISNLRNKISNMQVDQDSTRRKNEELIQALREKTRKHLQIQELYDKLKRRAMLGQVQNAALDAVDSTIQASVAAHRCIDKLGNQNQHPPQHPLFSVRQNSDIQYPATTAGEGANMPPPISRQMSRGNNKWAGFSSQESVHQNQPIQTLSTHRQRLTPGSAPTPRVGHPDLQSNGISGNPMQQRRASPRQPFAPLNSNVPATPGFAGYGMSAGLKVSNPAGTPINGFARPMVRSRVAQRPSPGTVANRNSTFGPPQANMFSHGDNYY